MSIHRGGKGYGHISRWPKAASSGPTVASLLTELNAFDATVSTWNPADDSTVSKSAERLSVSAVTTDGPVGQLFDRKAGHDLVATADTARPANTNGLTWDGTSDLMAAVLSTPPATITVGAIYKGTDTTAVAWADNTDNTPLGITWEDASAAGSVSSGTVWVDGVSVTNTRDAVHTAVADGSVHGIEHRAFVTSGWTNLGFSGYVSIAAYRVSGILLPLYILDPAQADYADALVAAHAYRDAVITELGLGN